jgi:hypothetical protein
MQSKFGGFSLTAANDVREAQCSEQRVLAEIERLHLEQNAWELDVKGYTVLKPDQVGPRSFVDELREAILKAAERRHGVKADPITGLGRDGDRMAHGAGIAMPGMLLEGRLFEQAMMNERVLVLVTYLLGESCELSSMGAVMKSQSNEHLELHADLVGNPAPFPPYAQAANATWALTDYTPENGTTCFVDGSHLKCRPPTPEEATNISLFKAVEAPAGSVLVWGSNIWHGALPRTAPGLRMSLLCFFSRWYLYKAEPTLASQVTQEMTNRNPLRFRRLLGLESDVPVEERNVTKSRCAYSQFA